MNCLQCSAGMTAHETFCQRCGAPVQQVELNAIDTERFQLLKQLFEAALRVPAGHRGGWVVAACRGDLTLAAQLQELLRRHELQTQTSATAETGGTPGFIGPYRLLRELGRGGMGVVHLALRDDGAFQKQVALKVLLRDQVSPDFVQRFRNERQVLAALDHPNIARILDGGDTSEGMPFYVMEFVEGMPLDKYCEERKLPLADRVRLLQSVCVAVEYLHRSQVIHRDLKPANILVSTDGVVKLLDFGIAKSLGPLPTGASDLTTMQGAPMTPLYASPEQMAGVTALQPTSDIYSLGVIGYKLLTGRTPFDNLEEKLAQIHVGNEPPLPSSRLREDLMNLPETTNQYRRRLIGDLDQIILMALRRRPEDRYGSALSLSEDLQRFLNGETVLARPGSGVARLMKFLVRKKVAVGIAASFLVLAAVGGWQTYRIYDQSQEADRRFAEMRQLLDSLESSAGKKPESELQAVSQLRRTLERDLTRAAVLKPKASAERQQIIERSARFLEKLRPHAAGNPALAEEVSAAYQQMGIFQENATGRESALANYQAAAELLRALPPERLRLAAVEQRLRFLEQRVGTGPAATPELAKTAPVAEPAAPLSGTGGAQPMPVAPESAAPIATMATTPVPEALRPAVARASTQEVDEVETRLVNVSTKAQSAEQNLEPLRARLQQQGMTLSPSVMEDLGLMRSSLLKARRQFASGDVGGARETLEAAEVFATRVLRAAGR